MIARVISGETCGRPFHFLGMGEGDHHSLADYLDEITNLYLHEVRNRDNLELTLVEGDMSFSSDDGIEVGDSRGLDFAWQVNPSPTAVAHLRLAHGALT